MITESTNTTITNPGIPGKHSHRIATFDWKCDHCGKQHEQAKDTFDANFPHVAVFCRECARGQIIKIAAPARSMTLKEQYEARKAATGAR
jgi:hypothetical protein